MYHLDLSITLSIRKMKFGRTIITIIFPQILWF